MRKGITAWAMLLLAAAIGFLGWQLLASERQQAKLADAVSSLDRGQQAAQAALDETRSTLGAMREEQEQVRASLADLQVSPGSLLLRGDVVAVSAMRVALAEYYMTTGKWPARQVDAGLLAPEQYRGRSMRSATVHADGRIELVFDAASGVDGGRIRFVPDVSHVDAAGIQWYCETADYAEIQRVVPGCQYRPAQSRIAVP